MNHESRINKSLNHVSPEKNSANHASRKKYRGPSLAPVTQMIVTDLFVVWKDMAFTVNKLGRNFKQGVQNCKIKDKIPVRVADFASCEAFAEWRQNFPKLAGNL